MSWVMGGAMEEAMRELRSQPGYLHPYYWAPFIVMGMDGPLRLPTLPNP
jgi:CHAT domain-containing protein